MKLLVNFDENEYKALRMFKNSGVEIESQSLRAIADGAPFDDEAAVIKKLFNVDKITADGVEYIDLNISEEDKDYISKVIELEWYKKAIEDIKTEIKNEAEFAYADFERYKVECLGQNREDVYDSFSNDDFRYGMERCLEIIGRHINGIRKETT